MPPVDAILLVACPMLAAALLSIGYWIGRRQARSQRPDTATSAMDDEDRQQMVGLLQSLSRWTNEYSGNVSSYQSNLKQLSRDVRQSLSGAQRDQLASASNRDEATTLGDARMMTLITQIMDTNETLQSRLDAAETQFAEQTQQIESYLTEARIDALTGLPNRRAFDKQLNEMFVDYRTGGSPFVLILVDIDHFKTINDTYGHPVGDLTLQQIASRLGAGLSDAIMVARFGGEEFAILAEAPLRDAAERMNELRKQIAEEPIQVSRQAIHVTMSVGLTESQDELIVGPIVRRADEALYCAKNRGRNRVYFDDGSGPQLAGAPAVARS